MNAFVGAMKGAMNVIRPNVKPGETVAIVGSTDVDDLFHQALMAAGHAIGAETTLALMTPRLAFGRTAPSEQDSMPLHLR